jgi:hypothetical protein
LTTSAPDIFRCPYVREIDEGTAFHVTKPSIIPPGCWPRRMTAELAAGYCGEPSVDAFLGRVGKEYPHPRVNEGRRRLWLRDDLDRAIAPEDLYDRDAAAVL